MNYLENYYSNYNEDGRLLSRHGQVEYLTTMKYIHELSNAAENNKVLEVGAGTGRYSIALAKEGYRVDTLEFTTHNLEIMNSKIDGPGHIRTHQGTAQDFKCLSEEKDLFEMVRIEEINEINSGFDNIERIKIVAADGATTYMRECVDDMDDATFEWWMKYHFSTCERQDLTGATNHSLDILRKI